MPDRFTKKLDQFRRPKIKVKERSPHVIEQINKYVNGHKSETDRALLRWHKHKKDAGLSRFLPRVWRNIIIHHEMEHERSRRTSKPAALRQLSIHFKDLRTRRSDIPSIQVVPYYRHASSGYPYPE